MHLVGIDDHLIASDFADWTLPSPRGYFMHHNNLILQREALRMITKYSPNGCDYERLVKKTNDGCFKLGYL